MRMGDRKNVATTCAANPSQLAAALATRARRLAQHAPPGFISSGLPISDIRLLRQQKGDRTLQATQHLPRESPLGGAAVPSPACPAAAARKNGVDPATRTPGAHARPADVAADATVRAG